MPISPVGSITVSNFSTPPVAWGQSLENETDYHHVQEMCLTQETLPFPLFLDFVQ